MRYLTSALLLFSVTVFASSADEQADSILHYQTRSSMILVTVPIDGRNRTLIFDTGAEQTMINFPQVSREQKMELWQRRYVYIRERSRVKLGNTNLSVEVIKADLTGTSLLKVADGVLGQDVLSNFRSIHINYRQQTIELLDH
jgi:hypothetical protein